MSSVVYSDFGPGKLLFKINQMEGYNASNVGGLTVSYGLALLPAPRFMLTFDCVSSTLHGSYLAAPLTMVISAAAPSTVVFLPPHMHDCVSCPSVRPDMHDCVCPLQVCFQLRAPCPTLPKFCYNGICTAALFNSAHTCCPTTSLPSAL